jgi:hypothetical protein
MLLGASVSEQEKIEPCASCGKPSTNRLVTELDITALCDRCTDRRPTEEESLPPPKERFDALFRAARVLLREGIDQEDQIIPTLVFARLACKDGSYVGASPFYPKLSEDAGGWERWVDKWVSLYRSLRPVRIVDEVLILERLPISIGINYEAHREHPEDERPKMIWLAAYPHRQPAKPEHVASLYEKTLKDAGVPYGEPHAGRMGFDLSESQLLITIERWLHSRFEPNPEGSSGFTLRTYATPFPTPQIVQKFYQMLLGKPSGEEFYKHLATRTRGGAPNMDNLILACVAFYLRNSGRIQHRKEIHRLLNEHVLCEKRYKHKAIPEEGYTSSKASQLWRDVKDDAKVREPLKNAELTFYYEGDNW